jgi:hypothetical protein
MTAMSLTTVTGRVRGTVRLKESEHAGAGGRVVATSWASDRSFPRTTGAAVAFELEAGDGAVYRVDPFDALVALPVREKAVRAGVRHEAAWIAVADEITVEGEVASARGRAPAALRARRIAMSTSTSAAANGAGLHRLPPRALQRAESERIEGTQTPAAATAVEVPAGEPATETPSDGAPRKQRKKRGDGSGTPSPVA